MERHFMHIIQYQKMMLPILLCTLFGCSDDASDSNNYTLTAIDGYLAGVEIYADCDLDNLADSDVFLGLTDADGTLTVADNYRQCNMIARAIAGQSLDSALGVITHDYEMIASPGSNVVTPYTTLSVLANISLESLAQLLEYDITTISGDYIAAQTATNNIIVEEAEHLALLAELMTDSLAEHLSETNSSKLIATINALHPIFSALSAANIVITDADIAFILHMTDPSNVTAAASVSDVDGKQINTEVVITDSDQAQQIIINTIASDELGNTTSATSTSTTDAIGSTSVETQLITTLIAADGSATITTINTNIHGESTETVTTENEADLIAPVITLNGETIVEHNIGENYSDLGATANDNIDGAVSVSSSGSVIIDALGSYIITYSAEDAAGNSAQLIRTVNVVDHIAPIITLTGDNPTILYQGRDYSELGATATDNIDTSISVDAPSGSVDVDSVGSYLLTYSATDSAMNVATITRTVTVLAARPFISRWQTTTGNQEVTININDDIDTSIIQYDYDVDWGDGSDIDTGLDSNATHTYTDAGTYTVTISGSLLGLKACANGENTLISVDQWGDIQWQSFANAFQSCANVQFASGIDAPDLRAVTSMSEMFSSNFSFNSDISGWDVSSVTDMSNLFFLALAFNQEISNWDVGNVTTMNGTFHFATQFNQNLSSWNITSVTDMTNMFNTAPLSTVNYDATLLGWSTQAVLPGVRLDAVSVHCEELDFAIAEGDPYDGAITILEAQGWTIDDGGVVPAANRATNCNL